MEKKEHKSESLTSKDPIGTYREGCPFFKNEQRELLVLCHGLGAEIVGIVASAEDSNNCCVFLNDENQDLIGMIGRPSEVTNAKVDNDLEHRKETYIAFCNQENVIEDILNIASLACENKSSAMAILEDLQKQIFAIKSKFKFETLVTSEKQRKKT